MRLPHCRHLSKACSLMNVSTLPNKHLTYCLNVHPGEDWDSNLEAIKTHALQVRDRVAPGQPFGLGLRLSYTAALTLSESERLAEFKVFLDTHDLYVFTINGFPFGTFHGTCVKEDVYKPDWRSRERLDYTTLLADILAALLPDGMSGSISTVPASYRTWIQSSSDTDAIVENLARCAEHLAQIESDTGRYIALALEPEPDCLFDTTVQTVAFFTSVLAEHEAIKKTECDWRRYLGVCFDTCHLSVVFDNPTQGLLELQRQGITIPKIQISTALRAATGGETAARLESFAEGTYLHQLRLMRSDGTLVRHADLTEDAIKAVAEDRNGEVRVHFHVPLYFTESGSLRSTANDLSDSFFRAVYESAIEHLEIETYTFNVLPPELANLPIEESIAKEYEWVLERFSDTAQGS